MKIFGVPFEKFGLPFNKPWKRVIMHLSIAILISGFVNFGDFSGFYKIAIVIFLSDIFQSFTHILIYNKLDAKFNWIEDTSKRATWGVILHTLGTLVNYFTVPLVCIFLLFNITLREVFYILLYFWYLPLFIALGVIVFAVAFEFFRNWKKSLASEEKIRAEMMNYKYEALRNQINPHFLLESFQSLKRLVHDDPKAASEFIQKISNLYRHVLEVKDKEFISLIEELQFIEPYIELLKFRYQNRLEIVIDIIPNEDDLIAPLCLQFLIENAVENNLQTESDNLSIQVEKKGDHIEITNSKMSEKSMLGLITPKLKNIEQQYRTYSSKEVEFQESNTYFLVKLPILKRA